MSETEKNAVYFGRGSEELYGEYLDFINYVFGFNGSSSDFRKLLPKLYKPEDKPVENSYVALENGKIKAAIGAFDINYSLFGEVLRLRGIGNVAVHPYERSRGFMKKLMNMAVDDMVSDGIDISVLGGRRQRYNYFSYEKTGSTYVFSLVNDNFRHIFGKDRESKYNIKRVSEKDTDVLEKIEKLYSSFDYHPLRKSDRIYDVMVSWSSKIYAAFDKCNGEFVGYCIYGDKRISESAVISAEYYTDFIVSFYDYIGDSSFTVSLPEFCPDYINHMQKISESYDIALNKSFSVLNYRKVIALFLKLKATYSSLPSGEFSLLIHGRAGDENLKISVDKGNISVTENQGVPDIELSHLEGMSFLFSPVYPARNAMPSYVRLWFPLPLWIYSADNV